MSALFISNITLRSLIFVFMVICMGLTGSLISTANTGNPQVNFLMFASAFGLLFGAFFGFATSFLSFLNFPMVNAILDFMNAVFAFAGATALAVNLRVHSCTNQDYIRANSVSQGSTDRCRKAQADTVFMYFGFVAFLVSLVLSITTGFRNGWGNMPRRAVTTTSTRPSMSQVA
ncbi:membrane-associating domain-containing protein [Dipodascopsis uninucleata]